MTAPNLIDMNLRKVIAELRTKFGGFNSPASATGLAELQASIGLVPEDVRVVYEDHDGSPNLPKSNGSRLVARLMPIAEAIETGHQMRYMANSLAKVGRVAWLWTDDNSNYCGVYTNGSLRGWLCILDHEESMPTPAFRSVASFMSRLVFEALHGNLEEGACDIPGLLREIPLTVADLTNSKRDRELSNQFYQRYLVEPDEDVRRLFAFCSICLTPVEDTQEATRFFTDSDMWTPEAAVRLMELRRWCEAVPQLETLAREGQPNGDSAAMRLLARLNTNESRQAVAHLKRTLQGRKLQMLEMWTNERVVLQPPRW